MARNGNIVEEVLPGSPADQAGIQKGDCIVSINRKRINDSIDLMFYGDAPEIHVSVKRKGRFKRFTIHKEEGQDLGVVLKPFTIRRCRNRCIFCFVSQLPRGLRRTLYIKDEDFRMSFLYGNYITLTNLTQKDRKRIVEQRLSPLYVSVHSTNKDIRNRLLGNRNATDIMKEIKWLTDNRIRIHAQVVLCPGYNDGEDLVNTIQDLHKYYPYVMSVAVVPVGLTKYIRTNIRSVQKEDAQNAIKIIQHFQRRYMKRYGDAFVHAADEFYIKAEKRFPPLKYYGDFPQIENGVGVVPMFLSQAKRCHVPKRASKAKFLTFTGLSFYPYLKGFIDRIREAVSIDVIPIVNRFFGKSVTVTGLLTGRDIIQGLSDVAHEYDKILLPDIVLRDTGDLLLDDVTVKDIEEIINRPVQVIDSTPAGLIKALEVTDED